RQRPDRVVLKLEVTNEGDAPAMWDREFSTFIKWRVKTADGTPLTPVRASDLARPTAAEVKARFAALQPGQSLAKEIDLTKAVRPFVSGHSSEHAPTGYEEVVRFETPRSATGLRVEAEYALGFDDRGGFFVWFQRRVEDVGLWQGKSQPAHATVAF